MKDFYSREEAIAFRDFLYAERSISNPRVSVLFLAISLESFLKEICKRVNLESEVNKEFKEIISTLCLSDTNPNGYIPKDIWYSQVFNNFLHAVRTRRNTLVHAATEDPISIGKLLHQDFNRFLSWYANKFDITDWRNVWETNKTKYKEEVTYELDEESKKFMEELFNKRLEKIEPPRNLEIISTETFLSEIISDETILNQLTLDYFLKFNNNQSNLKKVIANDIHITPDETFNFKIESENTQLSVSDIVSKANVGQPVLMKIMAVGGVGKSTLLWNLIKQYSNDYQTFFLRRADPECVQYIFQQLVKDSQKPILLFLDDVVSYDENRENLVRFAETISEFASGVPIVLIASERFYRYDKFKSKKEFEKSFSLEFTLHYSNNSIRDRVFDKIFYSLNLNSESVSSELKNQCKRIFNQHKFDSLIDSAFNLIVYLKNDFPNINYRFDWEDWNEACSGKFEVLNELFKVVSFFYQFGIQVPIDFLKDYFSPVRNVNDLLRELLGTFQGKYSPIVITIMDNGKQGLSLRHEKMGEWYFQIIPGGKESGKEFFNDFLQNVKSRSFSYLFRNISRKNSEFQLSPYCKELPNNRILQVIENYLFNLKEEDFEEEEYKLLMEKHFVLLNLGKDEQANEPLEKIIQLKPNNVFALARLAQCIQDSDFERAEKLYREVLKIEPRSTYAALGLFNLYHNNPSLFQFDIFQNEVFPIAKANLNFANVLLKSIDRNFLRLPTSTIKHLQELYTQHKVLGNDIAELLMTKGAFNDSLAILSGLESDFKILSRKYRSKTVQLLIKQYQIQNSNDDRSLKTAERILKEYFSDEENDSETNFFYAKLYSLSRKTSNFRQAEKFFTKAFEQDKSAKNFFAITRFYREYATHIIDKKENNLPTAITVFLKGINHIRTRLRTRLSNKLVCEIELCIFLNEIVQAYFFHSLQLDDSSKKYLNLITAVEKEAEELLEKCLQELTAKLPQSSSDLFSNYLVDEDDLQLYSKVCSISYDFYFNKVKRIQAKTGVIASESSECRQYLMKVKEILNKSLAFDEDNARLIINLIDIKISLKDDDISLEVEKINFSRFKVKQKARLCRLLIRRGYKTLGIKIIHKFGQLNSTDIKIKNDLAVCYIEAKLWSYAIKVFSDLKNANEYTLKILKRLALELPTNNDERAKAKIEFSREYLKRSPEDIRIIKRNICMTYFVTGDRDESFQYFKNNRFHVGTLATKELEQHRAFQELCNQWQNELIVNLAKNISIAETMVDKQERFDDGLEIISETLNDLLSLKIDYNSIIYNFKNEDPFKEKIKATIIKSINMLHTMIESRTEFSGMAFEKLFSIIKYYKNPLFNKVFINKLIKSESKTIFYKCIPALKYLESSKNQDPDIIRMLGRCYMMNGKFPQAKHFFDIGLKLSQNNKQLCYSHNNLADWIVTKIEKEKLKSFGNKISIKKQISAAEKHIAKSKELFPEFQYQEQLIGRLNALKSKYK